MNFRDANDGCEAEASELAAGGASVVEGTNTGISLSLGDNPANLFVRFCTVDGWKDGVFKLNLRFWSGPEPGPVEAGVCASGAFADAAGAAPSFVPAGFGALALCVDVELGLTFGWANAQPLFSNLQ